MLIISHSKSIKNPFKVRSTGKNGEVLKTSELLSTKKNCYKNILADLIENYSGSAGCFIIDETIDAPLTLMSIDVLRKKAGKK